MRLTFVHEWLISYAGSERVLSAAAELFPDAPIHTLLCSAGCIVGTPLAGREIMTSLLQRLPFAASRHRMLLPLMPFAVEQLDVSDANVILSSQHAVAHGVLTRADQLHVSYVHSPMRYAWDLHHDYLAAEGLDFGPRGLLTRYLLHRLRLWDAVAAQRVDRFVANSAYVARRINKHYRRRAEVIYPPVDVHRFDPASQRDDFYIAVSRLVPYKRIDLVVQAAIEHDRPLVVIGDGPERHRIEAIVERAGPATKVTLLGEQPTAVVADHLSRCRALIFAADEDFGIVPVEAMAAGAPVVALGRGGACETVVDGETGVWFEDQSVAGVQAGITRFEAIEGELDPSRCRERAERFSKPRFQRELSVLLDRLWDRFERAKLLKAD